MADNKYLKAMQQVTEHVGKTAAAPIAEDVKEQAPRRGVAPDRRERVGRPPGKRSNPDWEQVTVFIRKDTKRAVVRRLMDDESRLDLSEVIEQLLAKWAKVS
jgi:hypothetical protein